MGLLEQQNDSLLPVTANPKLLAQALKARQQPRTQLTGQGLLDTAAIGLSPVPIVGDALGLAADASRFYNEPESRTPLNFGLAALGLLPFVPSGVGAVKKMTQFEKAHEVAQKNAALPVAQGGLGLPPNNTAMDRADVMFPESGYHATGADISKIDPSKVAASDYGTIGQGFYIDPSKNAGYSNLVARINQSKSPQNIMPLRYNADNLYDLTDMVGIRNAESSGAVTKNLKGAGYSGAVSNVNGRPNEIVMYDPSKVRSKFAAFDPMRRNENNLLANVAPFGLAGLLGLGLYDAKQGD